MSLPPHKLRCWNYSEKCVPSDVNIEAKYCKPHRPLVPNCFDRCCLQTHGYCLVVCCNCCLHLVLGHNCPKPALTCQVYSWHVKSYALHLRLIQLHARQWRGGVPTILLLLLSSISLFLHPKPSCTSPPTVPLSLPSSSTGTLQFEPPLWTDMSTLILLLMNVKTVWATPISLWDILHCQLLFIFHRLY
jgi:hypothetical protein